jgi:hypothetical protein
MADVISAKESAFFALAPMLDFTWDANLRTSSGALRSSFFIPAICFAVMFVYAVVFRSSKSAISDKASIRPSPSDSDITEK